MIKRQKIPVNAESLLLGSPEREAAYKSALDDMIQSMAEAEARRTVWDFSGEKSLLVFAQNDAVMIRPVSEGDADFYVDIRMQYSMMYRALVGMQERTKEGLFVFDVCRPNSFFCIIEKTESKIPVGYLGIKDTDAEVWEIAIELDKKHTHQGIGSQSIKLFLNEINRITGKTAYRATVEPDNIPSQRCFERLGAELVGLCDGEFLKTPEEKERFEENHKNLIDDNIKLIADRLKVDPKRLLSHLLDYRITCPL